jgi:hypothetical protein
MKIGWLNGALIFRPNARKEVEALAVLLEGFRRPSTYKDNRRGFDCDGDDGTASKEPVPRVRQRSSTRSTRLGN